MMFPSTVMLATLVFTFLLSPLRVHAIYTIDSTTITGQAITCAQADDCVIDCEDCDGKTLTCETGYACTIHCRSCDSATIVANQVTSFDLFCDNNSNCYSALVSVSLSQLDSQFSLWCLEPAVPSTSGRNACRDLDATVDHIESVYTSTAAISGNSVVISCVGAEACLGLYVDSTVRGNFHATCQGGEDACRATNLVYTPPQGIGQMNVECLDTNTISCRGLNLVSVSTRQVNLVCGSATASSSDANQGPCNGVDILGPVLPFDVAETDFSWNTIHTDSVTVQCNEYECQGVTINVPFAANQTLINDFTYDWDRGSYVRYTCGYDFASSGWNQPDRRFDCDCMDSLEQIVLQPLIDGASVIVTNKYAFSLATQDTITCPVDADCIVYSTERYNAGRDTYWGGDYDSAFQAYVDSQSATRVTCPTDGVSYCYVFAVQPYGLSLATIDGSRSQRLLVRGLDVELSAESVFTFATIYAPDRDYVPDGAILFFEAGNAVGSFRHATIHAENTWMSVVPQIFDALIGATWYHGDSDWLNIDCDYHRMCQNMTLHANHDAFDINGDADAIIPSSVCIACSEFYADACAGMQLFVTDTSVTPPAVHEFNVVSDNTTGTLVPYWVSADDDTKKIRIAPTGGGAGSDNTCSDVTEQNLDYSWYGWGDWSNPACDGGSSGGGDNDGFGGIPVGCNWIYALGIAPALDDFCYASPMEDATQVSWEQSCVDGVPTLVAYFNDTSCSSANGTEFETNGVCNATETCGYATLTGYTYDQTAAACNDAVEHSFGFLNRAIFVDVCMGDTMWQCLTEADGADVLIRYEFDDDSSNCSNLTRANMTQFEAGNCIAGEGIYVESVSCPAVDSESCAAVNDTLFTGWAQGLATSKCELCLCEKAADGETVASTIVSENGDVVKLAQRCGAVRTNLSPVLQKRFMDTCVNLECNFDQVVPLELDNGFECSCDGFECSVVTTDAGVRLGESFALVMVLAFAVKFVCF